MKCITNTVRLFLITLSFVLVCSCLIGCEETTKEIVSPDTTVSTAAPSDGTDEEPAETEEPAAKDETPTIEEQVLIDYNGIKVTAKEYKADTIWGDGISLLLENNSSSDVGISVDELIINNYMVSNLFSKTVAAGKKSNETLDFSKSDLEKAGITSVGQIEATFHFFDPDTYDTFYASDIITIKTSAFDTMSTEKQDDGYELLNRDGVRIVGKYVAEDTLFGAEVILFIENNTGKDICVQCDDVSVNGFMVSSLFSSTVFNGKMAVDTIDLLSSDLEENDITSIDTMELKFNVFDADSFDTIFETDPITFNTQG